MRGPIRHALFDGGNFRRREARHQPIKLPHRRIRDGHHLAVHILGSRVDRDDIARGLRHALHAVRTWQDAADDAHQRFLAERLLQFAPRHDDIEQLVRAAHLNIRLHGNRVVALHQRVECFVQKDRFAFLETIGKIIARQKLLDGEILPQPDQVHQRKFREPFAVVADFRLGAVEQAKGLVGVRCRVGGHLLRGQDGTRLVLIRGIAHQRGVIPNQEGYLVAEFLELAQFLHRDGMAEMQVGMRRIESAIDAQGPALFFCKQEPLAQFGGHGLFQVFVAILRALHQKFNLFVNVHGILRQSGNAKLISHYKKNRTTFHDVMRCRKTKSIQARA